MLATCSDKGTVIRVFSVPGAEKIAQFRRGSYPARIFSINFNLASTLLAVSSDSDTIHIFKLSKSDPSVAGTSNSQAISGHSQASSFASDTAGSVGSAGPSYGYEQLSSSGKPASGGAHSATASLRRRSLFLGRNLAGSLGGYLPSGVTEMWEPQRDFAHVKLRSGGVRCVAALSG